MQLFSADATVFSKKLKKKIFDPENMKKLPSKVAHNRHLFSNLFFQYWPGCPNGPKTEIPYLQSPLMQDWVFRLGCF